MMRFFRTLYPAMILLVSLLSSVPLFSQEEGGEKLPVVGIIPVRSVESGESGVLEGLNRSLTETLELTVRFIDGYRVERAESFSGAIEGEDIEELCDRRGFDTVLFGRSSLEEDGTVSISLSAYDRLEGEIVAGNSETAESLLDTFEATDRLVATLVEDFSDVHIEYGSIRLRYSGYSGDVRVLIDGSNVGEGVESIAKMVAGSHRIQVVDATGGEGPLYFDREVRIEPDEVNELHVSIPLVEASTREKLSALDREIAADWHQGREDNELIESFEEAAGLIEDSHYPGKELLREKYARWRGEIAVTETDGIHDEGDYDSLSFYGPWRGEAGLEELSELATGVQGETVRDVASMWRREKSRSLLPYRSMEIDGGGEDWRGMSPIFTDSAGDHASDLRGTDITGMFLAMDSEYIYLRFRFANGNPSTSNRLIYGISNVHDTEKVMDSLTVEPGDGAGLAARIVRRNFEKGHTIAQTGKGCDVALLNDGFEARYSIESYLETVGEENLSSPPHLRLHFGNIFNLETMSDEDKSNNPPRMFLLYRDY